MFTMRMWKSPVLKQPSFPNNIQVLQIVSARSFCSRLETKYMAVCEQGEGGMQNQEDTGLALRLLELFRM